MGGVEDQAEVDLLGALQGAEWGGAAEWHGLVQVQQDLAGSC